MMSAVPITKGGARRGAVHQPFHQRAVAIPEDNVGAAVAAEIAGPVNVIVDIRVTNRSGSAKQRARTVQ